eukprot:CAMPEP_0114447704 /NCGR_PEP_ID=MMETSP0103-20121206/19922_1 /TAXON_ID=37642 ORGANISM="Paraphysomonas imperforata, Strain PA2" /NCGR_SAMPLE_ID=MMETSP0103 /ASSEMBLY_ACC=CAM_ASM_000201 /LENGTH=258 /DNA_ID=CAMNT_0001619647 /DNA_START=402 /DNA_END=1178 /DNA_ORIENTATION=-
MPCLSFLVFILVDFGTTTYLKFRVIEVRDATNDDRDPKKFPLLVNKGKSVQSDDFLTEDEKNESIRARELFETVSEYEFDHWEDRYREVQPHPWSSAAQEAMIFLIYADLKFTACWNKYLQYCLPHRSKGASSGKWYQVKKEIEQCDAYHGTSRWLCNGARYTKDQCLKRALEILLTRRQEAIDHSKQLDYSTNPEQVIGNKRFIKGKTPTFLKWEKEHDRLLAAGLDPRTSDCSFIFRDEEEEEEEEHDFGELYGGF